MRHFVDLYGLTSEEAGSLIDRAYRSKRRGYSQTQNPPLSGRTLGLLFEKPSLRTRVSFEAAIAQLGGSAIFLDNSGVGLGVRESIADFSRVISQYVDALAVRTYAHETILQLAEHASIPVINALSDESHPCQAMADLLTVREIFGKTEGIRLTFVGDGNNVARSLALACALLGARFTLSCPKAYDFPEEFHQRFQAAFPNASLTVDHDQNRAVSEADVIYTDVWASMGQENQAKKRQRDFAAYQVNAQLMAIAPQSAILLHCLPAHRGEEVTDEVLDGPQSRVLPQAANRLHFQKELLLWLMKKKAPLNGRKTTSPRRSGSRK